MGFRTSPWTVLLCVLATSACRSPESQTDRFVEADSAGVVIANSTAPLVSDPVVVEATPVATVTSDFDSPDHVLYGANYGALLSDGSFVIGNRGTKELFFFGAGGQFRGAMGGEGDGPGEFQRLFDLYRCSDDRLVVEELSRLSVLHGRSMEFEENVQISGHLARTRADVAGVRGDCSAVLMVGSPSKMPECSQDVFDYPATLYWADLKTGARDTVGTFTGTQAVCVDLSEGRVPVRAPYGRVGTWSVHPLGVVVGLGDDAEYSVFGPGGRVVSRVRWRMPRPNLSAGDWRYFTESRATYLREHPDQQPYEAPLGSFSRPEERPWYAAVLVDDVARVWVRTYGRYGASGPETTSRWWVFTREGEWLAEVQVPEGLQVLAIADHSLLGVARDDMGLEEVRLYRFQLPG